MPQIKSQIKRMKTSEERRERNRQVKSEIHTYVKNFKSAVEAGDKEVASESYAKAIKKLDRAANKGVIHKNKAANQKSRLTKRLNSLA